jgi:hypothetical protein
MGSGRWSTNVYAEHARYKAAAGMSTFDYSDNLHRSPHNTWRVHPALDPHGVQFRESRDSDEHPESTAIAILFDVTGSMLNVPVTLQSKLPGLLGLLLRKDYIAHPQILFGGIGDATCDRVPLQIGQYESDNRMDENLEDIFLEGGGGGQKTESYELAMYFMARHTDIDCWNKRRHKGYLFLIGDEMAYPRVSRRQVRELIGGGLQREIRTDAIVRELRERYNVFYILPRSASYGGDPQILGFWRNLLGEHVLELDDPAAVCETIALTIGLHEGAIDLQQGAEDLRDLGADRATRKVVSTALANMPVGLMKARSVSAALPGL